MVKSIWEECRDILVLSPLPKGYEYSDEKFAAVMRENIERIRRRQEELKVRK